MKISCKKFKTHLQFYMNISIKNFSSFFTWKSLVIFFQKSSPKNWTHLQFYKRNPYTKIIFNFNQEIPLKIFSKKKSTLKFGLKSNFWKNFTKDFPVKNEEFFYSKIFM